VILSADKLKSLTDLASSMVIKASAKENVLRIPEVIEEFVPRRVGHKEH